MVAAEGSGGSFAETFQLTSCVDTAPGQIERGHGIGDKGVTLWTWCPANERKTIEDVGSANIGNRAAAALFSTRGQYQGT